MIKLEQTQLNSIITAINNRAKLASPTFTGTVSGITKAMVGLGNVDNTSDLLKPVATTTVNGIMSAADKTKLNAIEAGATADQTAAEILTALKTVDGSGSGLDSDLLDGLDSTKFVRTDINSTMTGNLHVNGVFSVSGQILTKRYIQIIAVERDSIIKDRINYVGTITLPFNCNIIELRAKTDSGTTIVAFKNNGLVMTTINATSTGNSTTVLSNASAPKFSPITFDTSSSSGSGLTITITAQEI